MLTITITFQAIRNPWLNVLVIMGILIFLLVVQVNFSLCHKNGSLVNGIQGLPFLFHFLLTENKLLLDYLELISVSFPIYMDVFRYQAIRNFVGV
jgi:hypothetical protein